MTISLTDDLKDFVRKKVASGDFPTEEAVLQEAVRRFRRDDEHSRRSGNHESATLEDLIDYEAIASCEKDADDSITLEEVRAGTATIRDSMARVIIEEERAERF
jgi:Arc/MetJ-type ribon-helix-helix transcriptional regulator